MDTNETKTLDDFYDLIVNLLQEGLDINMRYVDETIWYDLNTGMKSDLKITYIDGKFLYKGRYSEISGVFDDIDDLRSIGRECMCGRDYMSGCWADFLGGH